MARIHLGSMGLEAEQNGFGALPIQRISSEKAVAMLRRAYEAGITYFDTARAYTDSEEKIGLAFGDMGIRERIIIATKTHALNPQDFWQHLETSLRNMKTDYIDIYQFHNPEQLFRPGDGSGMYECMLEAKERGLIRHIGFTSHSIDIANECIDSGLYESLQFPFSYITGENEMNIVKKCKEAGMLHIAMKGMAGGLITSSAAAYAFITQYDNIMPIWGVQTMDELEEFISYTNSPPVIDDTVQALMAKDRAELSGGFCRSCGYCMPCAADINIRQCARMSLLLRRSPWQPYMSEEWQAEMSKIDNCISCGACLSRCPYKLNVPELLKVNLEDYRNVLSGKTDISAK